MIQRLSVREHCFGFFFLNHLFWNRSIWIFTVISNADLADNIRRYLLSLTQESVQYAGCTLENEVHAPFVCLEIQGQRE